MPDISMCASADCLLKNNCYRHAASGTVPTPKRQSYGDWQWHCLTVYEKEWERRVGVQCLGLDFIMPMQRSTGSDKTLGPDKTS
jgi:hypothetical protein